MAQTFFAQSIFTDHLFTDNLAIQKAAGFLTSMTGTYVKRLDQSVVFRTVTAARVNNRTKSLTLTIVLIENDESHG